MKKKNVFIIILILIISFFKINVEAATCTTQEKNELIQEAKMLQIIPVLEDEENEWHEYQYGVSITNWNKNFYIETSNNIKFYQLDDYSPENLYGQFRPGSVETFKVYVRYGNTCAFEHLTTIRVTFDHYNHYYSSPLCEGIEEFKLCQRTYSGKIESAEWFEKEVTKYKESLTRKPEEKEPMLEKITNYIKENPIVIIASVVVIILITIIVIKKVRTNKKRIKIDLDLK